MPLKTTPSGKKGEGKCGARDSLALINIDNVALHQLPRWELGGCILHKRVSQVAHLDTCVHIGREGYKHAMLAGTFYIPLDLHNTRMSLVNVI